MFSAGWQIFNGDQAETHSLNFSAGGKVGLAWIGGLATTDVGDVSFMESTDNGLTWTTPVKIFEAIPDPAVPGDVYGPIRGVNVNYFGEEACVVFEAGVAN